MEMAGIELLDVRKSYEVENRRIQVLSGINLSLPKESITVVLGKSGCGKTTLLRLVGGLETPDSGEIRYDTSQRTAFVFQEPRLMPWLNVKENICFGLQKSEISHPEIASIIQTVGLNGFEKAYPYQLSGGMQQRTSLARALAYKPSFIMMDEPFAALDYFTREQMQQELLRVQAIQKASILFVTHNIDEALFLGDKIVVIADGLVKAEFEVPKTEGERNLLDEEFIERKREIIRNLNEDKQGFKSTKK
jgi:sulfonate transport system ATP-binding protein